MHSAAFVSQAFNLSGKRSELQQQVDQIHTARRGKQAAADSGRSVANSKALNDQQKPACFSLADCSIPLWQRQCWLVQLVPHLCCCRLCNAVLSSAALVHIASFWEQQTSSAASWPHCRHAALTAVLLLQATRCCRDRLPQSGHCPAGGSRPAARPAGRGHAGSGAGG